MLSKYEKCGETYYNVDCSGILDVWFGFLRVADSLMESVCNFLYWVCNGHSYEDKLFEDWKRESNLP